MSKTTAAGVISLSSWLLAALLLFAWPGDVAAMRPSRIANLRKETVSMFYHGFDNYMQIAFPEDEVRETNTPTPKPLSAASSGNVLTWDSPSYIAAARLLHSPDSR